MFPGFMFLFWRSVCYIRSFMACFCPVSGDFLGKHIGFFPLFLCSFSSDSPVGDIHEASQEEEYLEG